jgi:stage II sporulation protein D
LQKIEIESFTTCGRVKSLAVTLSGETYHVYGDKVRWLLRRKGPDRPILRSACFVLEVSKSGAAIKKVKALGRGFGHGVGMSQMGAIGMALAGKKAEEIIPFYYTGVTLAIARY